MRNGMLVTVVSIVVAMLAIGCSKGGGSAEPAQVNMVSTPISLNTFSYTIQAPEGATIEPYMNVAVHIFAGDYFKVRITPRDDRPIATFKAEIQAMNLTSAEFPVDEPNALMAHTVDRGGIEDYAVYTSAQLGDTTVLCESVGAVSGPFTRAMADRMLEACRGLALAQ